MAAGTDAAVATDTEILLAELCSLIEFLILFLREKISQGVPPVCQLTKCLFVFFHEMKRITGENENVFFFKGLREQNSLPFLVL